MILVYVVVARSGSTMEVTPVVGTTNRFVICNIGKYGMDAGSGHDRYSDFVGHRHRRPRIWWWW
ncbi:vegetative cell wall protein gp1-like [Iris pallida]|uniref:Vegetative cell wall protein gp1-like n=1 Tax=Iris pallida TaxID=29817 RepID=A0AAX6E7Y0_IRIPA|nr:vegetative cell wall protein gp1-like [Iris pallida]